MSITLTKRDRAPGDQTEPERRRISLRGVAEADPEWHLLDDPGPAMVAMGNAVGQAQGWRRLQNLRLARLYSDRDFASIYSVAGMTGSMLGLDVVLGPKRSSWNVVRAACDVAQARVGKNRGRCMFVSVAGEWSLRRKAKLRTRFIDGAFRQADFYGESQKVFLDAVVFGIGVLAIYSEHGQLRSERVLPDEILVEHGAAIHGRPRVVYRRRPMPRPEAHRLLDGDPKDEGYARRVAAIDAAPVSSAWVGVERCFAAADVIDVWTATCLPSAPDAGDGRRVVAVEGCTISSEPWDRPRHPYAVFRWGTALSGWYGLGVAEQLVGTQLKIRQLQYAISTAEYHVSTPKILAPTGSKLNAKAINNDARGTVVYYSGPQPPQWITPSSVNPELFQDLEREWSHGFDQVGLPPAGSGAVPTNIKSGEGIRAYTEAVDARLAVPAQRWDQYAVDAAEVFLDEVREMGDAEVPVRAGRDRWERYSWKDIAAQGKDEDYYLQPWPTSILPATPSGRFDRLQEMEQAGWLTKEQAMAALEVPDLEGIVSLELSSYELVGMQVEKMLDDGVPEQPEPYQDLGVALKIAQAAYVKARCEGAPEDRLSLLRDYIDGCRSLQQQAQQPPAGAAPAPGPAQGAAPPSPDQQAPGGGAPPAAAAA